MPRGKANTSESGLKPSAELLRMLMLKKLLTKSNYPTGLAKELQAEGVNLNEAYASTLMIDLKEAGLAESKLVFSDAGRPRRMYTLTAKGKADAAGLIAKTVAEYQAALRVLAGK